MITSVSPNSGPVAGGTVVTISGSGFLGATVVNFGATAAASFTVNSDSSITATAPAGAAAGAVDVTVTAPGGTSATSVADVFTYVAPLPQTINFTQPSAAYAGTAVLLSATGGSSSSPVIFSVISGPATATGTNGSTLTYTGAGTVVVEADQAGDVNYTAAPAVQKTITSTILTEPLTTTSAAVPTLVTFSTAGTLSAMTGLTQGKANGDFNIVPGGNCAPRHNLHRGQTCTVNFTLTPAHPGLRAMAGLSHSPTLPAETLASTYMYGIGTGPQVNFSPATQTIINTNVGRAVGVVFDGLGNLFVSSESTGLFELTAASGYNSVISLNNTFVDPLGIAIDGIGNLFFVTDRASQHCHRTLRRPRATQPRVPSAAAGVRRWA